MLFLDDHLEKKKGKKTAKNFVFYWHAQENGYLIKSENVNWMKSSGMKGIQINDVCFFFFFFFVL